MAILHSKAFGIYHWDTFERPGEDTFLIEQADSLEEAEAKIKEHYGDRLRANGADRVEIVDRDGNIVRSHQVA